MNKNGDKYKKKFKMLAIIVVNFIILYAVYRLIINLAERYSVWIYYIGMSAFIAGGTMLFCLFYAKNGYTFSNEPTPAELLPQEWSDVEKTAFLRREAEKKAGARKLIYFMLSIILVVFVSYIELFFIDFIKTVFH